ncbi:hypothetical protein ACJX0J_036216, partial [Zea mays]
TTLLVILFDYSLGTKSRYSFVNQTLFYVLSDLSSQIFLRVDTWHAAVVLTCANLIGGLAFGDLAMLFVDQSIFDCTTIEKLVALHNLTMEAHHIPMKVAINCFHFSLLKMICLLPCMILYVDIALFLLYLHDKILFIH